MFLERKLWKYVQATVAVVFLEERSRDTKDLGALFLVCESMNFFFFTVKNKQNKESFSDFPQTGERSKS